MLGMKTWKELKHFYIFLSIKLYHVDISLFYVLKHSSEVLSSLMVW